MEKVNFQINQIQPDDAIVLIIGMETALRNNPFENEFISMLKMSLDDTKNQVIKSIGNSEYMKLYNEIFQTLNGILPNPDGKIKTNC